MDLLNCDVNIGLLFIVVCDNDIAACDRHSPIVL